MDYYKEQDTSNKRMIARLKEEAEEDLNLSIKLAQLVKYLKTRETSRY